MKVLFFTRKIDKTDHRIGFAHKWAEELAKRVDKLYIVCLEKGKTDLPKNVEIKAIGKGKLLRLFKLDWVLGTTVPKVDVVFCHMNPIYTIVSSAYTKLFRKKLYMWHTHGKVTKKLKLAHSLADGLLTASEESVGIKSKKVFPMGHGIDTDKFKPKKTKHGELTLISVGRVSPVKRVETLVLGMGKLVKSNPNAKLLLVGDVPIKSQKAYMDKMKSLVSKLKLDNNIEFVGAIGYDKIVDYYNKADVFVSASATGSLDKTVLEAMSCELPAVVKGEVYKSLEGTVIFKSENDFTEKVEEALSVDGKKLRAEIIKKHNLKKLMDKIVKQFEK